MIDSDGNLFGVVNVIDALVVVAIVVMLAASIPLALQGQPSNNSGPTESANTELKNTTVVFRVQNQPSYKVDEVEKGPVSASDIVAVTEIVSRSDKNRTDLRLQITLKTNTTSDGSPTFRKKELYVGRKLTLQLGTARFSGTVTEIVTPQQTLTPFPTPTPTSTPTPTPVAETRVISFRTTGQPQYVVDAISTGPVPTEAIVAVKSKSVKDEINATTYTVSLTLAVKVHYYPSNEQLPMFQGERLYIGRQIRVDLGRTIVEGHVTEL